MYQKSQELFIRAQQSIPGGVNSPVRAFKSVGGTPLFIKKANGAYLYDADGNKYIDYINSWGPMILGHAYEPVVKAIQEKVLGSTSFGAPTELEIEMAELIKSMCPNVDLIRMVSSGTEACMSAIRLARGYTGRNKFIKFEGCYHGHADPFLVKAGSGVATFNIQTVPGVTASISNDTLTAPYNDLSAVEELVNGNKDEIAAIIIEPVAGNMGCVPPLPGYLEGLRKICDKEKILLVFDEVMTGFRLAQGGAQQRLKINADLVTYGKVIGGGMPVGATLKEDPSIYTELDDKTNTLNRGLAEVFKKKSIPVQVNQLGSMISVHFSAKPVIDFASSAASNTQTFNKFFHFMLEHGIYPPPSSFETWFVSHSLSRNDIDKTIDTAQQFVKQL